jgi:hypothetical protein
MMKRRAVAALTIGVLIGALAVPEAGWAGGFRCRSDPAVVLSNGTVLDISADVDAMLWDIQAVSYTVRIPAGLRVIAVVRTPNWPTTKETFNVVADQAPGVYDTVTTVRTPTRTAVRANLVLVTLTSLLNVGSKDGYSGDALRLGIATRTSLL